MSDIVRKLCLHTAGVTGSNPVPPTKQISDLRHLSVAFLISVPEKCRKAGLDLRASPLAGVRTQSSVFDYLRRPTEASAMSHAECPSIGS